MIISIGFPFVAMTTECKSHRPLDNRQLGHGVQSSDIVIIPCSSPNDPIAIDPLADKFPIIISSVDLPPAFSDKLSNRGENMHHGKASDMGHRLGTCISVCVCVQ